MIRSELNTASHMRRDASGSNRQHASDSTPVRFLIGPPYVICSREGLHSLLCKCSTSSSTQRCVTFGIRGGIQRMETSKSRWLDPWLGSAGARLRLDLHGNYEVRYDGWRYEFALIRIWWISTWVVKCSIKKKILIRYMFFWGGFLFNQLPQNLAQLAI
jgi:hypothetical protein